MNETTIAGNGARHTSSAAASAAKHRKQASATTACSSGAFTGSYGRSVRTHRSRPSWISPPTSRK